MTRRGLVCAVLGATLVAACSLDLDESLIQAGNDGAAGDAQSFGGFGAGGNFGGGSGGTDAASDSNDEASDSGDGASDSGNDGADGSNPDGVDCETETCAAGSTCCFNTGCVAQAQTCSSTTISCDSSVDCAKGELCCLDGSVLADVVVSCFASCPSVTLGVVQFCKLDTECPRGTTCQLVTSLVGLLVPSTYRFCQ